MVLLRDRVWLRCCAAHAGSLCSFPAIQVCEGGQHATQHLALRQEADSSRQSGKHIGASLRLQCHLPCTLSSLQYSPLCADEHTLCVML